MHITFNGHLLNSWFPQAILISLNAVRQNKTKRTGTQQSDYFAEKAELQHTQAVLQATFKMHKCSNYF